MRHLPLDFRDQYFGCEIELTGINRATAAQTLADLFGTRAEHSGGGYDAYRVKDLDGKEWKIVRDSSIHPECRRRSVLIGETYKVELNSPKLEYGEMEKLQEVVRALRRAGGIVNDSCGMHVHVDASKHTPQSLKNVLSIMYSKEDILFAALKVNPARIDSYCQAVDEPILEEIRKLPSGASIDRMLSNEKYVGNLLLQKTCTPDLLTGKQKKNCGEQSMFLVENAHEPIVSKEIFEDVQRRKHKM